MDKSKLNDYLLLIHFFSGKKFKEKHSSLFKLIYYTKENQNYVELLNLTILKLAVA